MAALLEATMCYSLHTAANLVELATSTDPSSNPRKCYDEITTTTEKSIRLILSQSESDRSNNIRDAWLAYGLYVAWWKLTASHRTPEDDERLHKLARRFRETP